MIQIKTPSEKKIGKLLLGLVVVSVCIPMLSGCIQQNPTQGLEIVIVGRDSASGTREFFWEHVMEKENFSINMLELNSNGAVHQTVSQTEGAIGYVGLGYLDNEVKALTINGIEATIANVISGEYPISRDMNLFTNGNATGATEEFLVYLDSDEGQAIVEEEGFVPKTTTGPYQKKEGLTGTVNIVGSTTVLPVAQLAAEAFNELYGTNIVTITGGGSSVGVQAVGGGSADIGMASRELKASEIEAYPALIKHVVCTDGIAVIVHPGNTYVNDLAIEQVKDIYKGIYTNWNKL